MMTLHTPNNQPTLRAPKLGLRVLGRLVPRFRPSGINRRPQVTWIRAGLFVLVVLTTLAIASVSPWWVPVYLALLAMIFVTPAKLQPSSSASQSGEDSETFGIVGLDTSPQGNHADELDELHSVSQFTSDQAKVDLSESTDSNPDMIAAGVAKRRVRVRARKTTNPTALPMTDPLPVVWIQIGPGKFVRVEGGAQAANVAQIEEASARDLPTPVTPDETTPPAPATIEPPAELRSFTSPRETHGEIEPISVSNDGVSGSGTEEYGIAPSAFSLTPSLGSSVEALDHDLPGQVLEPEFRSASPVEPGGSSLPSSTDSGPALIESGIARRWVRRIQRGITRVVPRVDRMSSRRTPSRSPSTRLSVGYSDVLNVSRRDAARRAFGRVLHVERTLRIRSPPRR